MFNSTEYLTYPVPPRKIIQISENSFSVFAGSVEKLKQLIIERECDVIVERITLRSADGQIVGAKPNQRIAFDSDFSIPLKGYLFTVDEIGSMVKIPVMAMKQLSEYLSEVIFGEPFPCVATDVSVYTVIGITFRAVPVATSNIDK